MSKGSMNFKIIGIILAVVLVVGVIYFAVARPAQEQVVDDPAQEEPIAEEPEDQDPADPAAQLNWDGRPFPAIGRDTNNGRPFNPTEKENWDGRHERFLHGVNATVLPIVEDPVTLILWQSFSSPIMESLHESYFFKELEARTGVKTEFVHPPVGEDVTNFNMRIAAHDLPHIFVTPPPFPGGEWQGVVDEIYLELTPYYERGLMPNFSWLRNNHHLFAEEIYRDTIDDEGRIFFWPKIDVIPSHPWSGLWVRTDWLEDLGLEKPETIDDWTHMLRTMRDEKDVAPLAINIPLWYGVATNYMFVSSFNAGYSWINKDGDVVFGPTLPGYRQWLELMNKWYAEGLIDPDFPARDFAGYNAHIAGGNIGAFGLAYGEIGPILTAGRAIDPDFSAEAVVMPTSYAGQVIRLRQNNAIVRGQGNREYFTTRLVDDGLDDIAVVWKDYWYSQDGGDLASYGPEGVSFRWLPDGEYEWIFPRLFDAAEGLDFWTIMPQFKVHNMGYLRDSTAYEFRPEVFRAIDTWATQSADWVMPEHLAFTPEEEEELAGIMTDVNTYRDEMTLRFIVGDEPMDNFDAFVSTIEDMGLTRAQEIMNASLDRYFARGR